MEISAMAKRHGNKPMRKKDFKQAFNTIKEIRAMIDGKLDNSKRSFRAGLMDIRMDKRNPDSVKDLKKDELEFNVLVAHEIVGSIHNALDKVESHWEKLQEKMIKE
ncbi:hypothetical protein IOL78_003835 [Salmonella enterica]|nr:hypothetical protein [Salmonella enterica]EII4381910.1 hypothetical protein [Salmonella enterica]